MHDVLISFTDDVDGGVYIAGKDTYPGKGKKPSKKRIAYLMGSDNKFGKPVISKSSVEDDDPVDDPIEE